MEDKTDEHEKVLLFAEKFMAEFNPPMKLQEYQKEFFKKILKHTTKGEKLIINIPRRHRRTYWSKHILDMLDK